MSEAEGASGTRAPVPDENCHKRRPDAVTLGAFALLVVLLAANPLVVRFTNRSLPPLWGAATRMAGGALLFLLYMAVKRAPIPRGRELIGTLAFGAIQFGIGFGLGYWALTRVTASIAGTMLASLPLFTMAIAAAARIEPLTLRGVAGSLISIGGIAVLLGNPARESVPAVYIAAMLGFVACLAGGLVIAKALPGVSPASLNGIGMLTGAVLLFLAAAVLREPKPLPSLNLTWTVQLYVIVVGSVGVFSLILFVLRRWTASATSYQTVLSPPVTIVLAALLLGEPISSGLVLGAAIVVVGVYVGVISHWHLPRRRSLTPRPS